jgi:hypothetical protein
MLVVPEAMVGKKFGYRLKNLVFFPDASASPTIDFVRFLDQHQYAECHARLVAEFSISIHNCHMVLQYFISRYLNARDIISRITPYVI